jgi:hypothetical protein
MNLKMRAWRLTPRVFLRILTPAYVRTGSTVCVDIIQTQALTVTLNNPFPGDSLANQKSLPYKLASESERK